MMVCVAESRVPDGSAAPTEEGLAPRGRRMPVTRGEAWSWWLAWLLLRSDKPRMRGASAADSLSGLLGCLPVAQSPG